MSIEIIFYPKIATKDDLKRHLVNLGFQPCENLMSWPEGSLHFSWFEEEDYKSFDGVEATIFPKSAKENLNYPGSSLALHTRTRASASVWDRLFQNSVIKTARTKFRGDFINDWHGRNRYTPEYPDKRDEVARGIFLLYEGVIHNIRAVKASIPDALLKDFKNSNPDPHSEAGKMSDFLRTIDPSLILYNALVPFVVTVIECFFKESFKILLKYDKQAQERILDQNLKVEIKDVIAISKKQMSLEDVIADKYSFQRISSIHSAFHEWFKIDFRGLIKKRKKIGKSIPVLENRLEEVISFRHGVIHGLRVNLDFSKEELKEMLQFATVLIDIFVKEIERRRGIPILKD